MLLARIFSAVKIKTNVSVISLSELKRQKSKVFIAFFFDAQYWVFSVSFVGHLSQNTVEVVHYLFFGLISRNELNDKLTFVVWEVFLQI